MAEPTAMTPAAMRPPDLTLTFGVFEIGILIVMFLTGIMTLQVWNYVRDYQGDPRYVKFMVAFVYVMDVFHSAVLGQALYHYTVQDFGDYPDLQKIFWDLDATTPLAGIVAFVVQTYFCLRIMRITGTWIYAAGCWILALARLILDCFLTAAIANGGAFPVLESPKTQALGLATLCVGAFSDVLIAGFLVMGFLRARSGFSSTDKLLDKLVAFSIGSGLLTSVVAVCEAITFGALNNFVFLVFYFILPKIFSNSLMVSLNERSYTRREDSNLSYSFRSTKQSSTVADQRVTVDRTTVTDREFELGTLDHSRLSESYDKNSGRWFPFEDRLVTLYGLVLQDACSPFQ
ncbi:hypothetical protein EXIGLDRAFT_834279 [Exidia glandulosa HHB12029]|uniref:DUF6534 domain-containing protein n=1 Tax=Exidia glandulosa HHB12029 TaxID=1314781 RepID=A0A165JWY7_EXIGL|nr:hypothetical protein EXIGLDRAFT_834279 [Exidia glandulosa HHB12029]